MPNSFWLQRKWLKSLYLFAAYREWCVLFELPLRRRDDNVPVKQHLEHL